MKKAVFAIQVFCLIAMFPIYVVAELNHTNGRMAINNLPSNNNKEAVKKSSQSTVNFTEENCDMLLMMFKITTH